MGKVINFKESSFDLVYRIIKEQIVKAHSNLSDDFKKHLFTPTNLKALEQFSSTNPRSYCPYIRRSEDIRILPFLALGTVTLDLCCNTETYYVPGYPIPRTLKVKGLQIDTPNYHNRWNYEMYTEKFFNSVTEAVKKEVESI